MVRGDGLIATTQMTSVITRNVPGRRNDMRKYSVTMHPNSVSTILVPGAGAGENLPRRSALRGLLAALITATLPRVSASACAIRPDISYDQAALAPIAIAQPAGLDELMQLRSELSTRPDMPPQRFRLMDSIRNLIARGRVLELRSIPAPRRFRARFHQASLAPKQLSQDANQLRGYVTYQQAFPLTRHSSDVGRYCNILNNNARWALLVHCLPLVQGRIICHEYLPA
jgi:hypothetical protein